MGKLVGMPVMGVRFRVLPAAREDWAAEEAAEATEEATEALGAVDILVETPPPLVLGQEFSYVVAVGLEPLTVRFEAAGAQGFRTTALSAEAVAARRKERRVEECILL